MSRWTGTLIGGGIGWALLGPLGGILGAYIGSMFSSENVQTTARSKKYFSNRAAEFGDTRAGDFAVAMLSLFAYISNVDKKVTSVEVQYVKRFLIEKFGADNAQDLLYLYKEILKKRYNINDVTKQVKMNMDYYSRLELTHVLFGIANADGYLHPDELKAIQFISEGLGISPTDFLSIKSIFSGNTNQAYSILNVSPEDTDDTIKKAYRDLASKYHPDKVSQLGPEIQKLAEEKFKAINDAYQTVSKERGF